MLPIFPLQYIFDIEIFIPAINGLGRMEMTAIHAWATNKSRIPSHNDRQEQKKTLHKFLRCTLAPEGTGAWGERWVLKMSAYFVPDHPSPTPAGLNV